MERAPVSDAPDSLALVSSLYGPGTIACWYLTTLSVLVSWTVHPRKRKSGSIDVDLLAVLTLAVVAIGHLVSQIPGLLTHPGDDQDSTNTGLLYSQLIAAFEAPLVVMEAFMMLSVILFLVAAWTICVRRAIAVALVGLTCFAVDCYIHFSQFAELDLWYKPVSSRDNQFTFSRVFVANFGGFLIIIMVSLVIYILLAIAIAIYLLLSSESSSSSAHHDLEGIELPTLPPPPSSREAGPNEDIRDEWRDYVQNKDFEIRKSIWIANISIVFLPITFCSALLGFRRGSAYDTGVVSTHSSWQMLAQDMARFGSDFFPKAASSITDLDQAVATAAGATVLAFNIYGAAKSYFLA